MTRARDKRGRFIRNDSLLAKLARMFRRKEEPAAIEHDPKAKERGTTRSR